jgi:hypothetical protein
MNVVSKIARFVTIQKRKIETDLVAFAPTLATNLKDKVDNKVSKVGVCSMEWLRSPCTLCWVTAQGALVKVSWATHSTEWSSARSFHDIKVYKANSMGF